MLAETEFQRRLESELDRVYAEKRDNLALGVCRHSHNTAEDYSYRSGYLAAIRDIGESINYICRSMNGENSEPTPII